MRKSQSLPDATSFPCGLPFSKEIWSPTRQAKAFRPCFCTTESSFSAMPLGFFAPVSHFSIVDSLVFRYRANTGWLTLYRSRSCFISFGAIGSGVERQRSSKLRIVALLIVPARYIPATLLWIASNASVLNLDFRLMTYLHEFTQFQFFRDSRIRFTCVQIG